MVATTSSIYNSVASNVIDQNPNGNWAGGSCIHTALSAPVGTREWVRLDMGMTQSVSVVNIINRQDCCTDRLAKTAVWVTNTATPGTGVQCGRIESDPGAQAIITCPTPISGRYVYLYKDAAAPTPIINICEIYLTLNTIRIPGSCNTPPSAPFMTGAPIQTVALDGTWVGDQVGTACTYTCTPACGPAATCQYTWGYKPYCLPNGEGPSSANGGATYTPPPVFSPVAYQSSTDFYQWGAEKLVDGCWNGDLIGKKCCSHTGYYPPLYMSLDLGTSQMVKTVTIMNRGDDVPERLRNISLVVGDINDYAHPWNTKCGSIGDPGNIAAGALVTLSCPTAVHAQYIFLVKFGPGNSADTALLYEPVHICEVLVELGGFAITGTCAGPTCGGPVQTYDNTGTFVTGSMTGMECDQWVAPTHYFPGFTSGATFPIPGSTQVSVASIVGSPLTALGHMGFNAGSFSGGSNFQFSNSAVVNPPSGPFSVAAWVRPMAFSYGTGSSMSPVSARASDGSAKGWMLLLAESQPGVATFVFSLCTSVPWNNASNPAVQFDVESWVHLVGVYDSAAGSICLYVNGRLRACQSGLGAFVGDPTASLRIGVGYGSSHPWTGHVEDVNFYSGLVLNANAALGAYQNYQLTYIAGKCWLTLPNNSTTSSTREFISGSFQHLNATWHKIQVKPGYYFMVETEADDYATYVSDPAAVGKCGNGHLPFGLAVDCSYTTNGFHADLKGTPYTLSANNFHNGGFQSSGFPVSSARGQLFDYYINGNCGVVYCVWGPDVYENTLCNGGAYIRLPLLDKPSPSASRTVTTTPTRSPSSLSPSTTPTKTPSTSPTRSITPSGTPTSSVTPSKSTTPSVTPSITPTPSVTPSITSTSSVTPSITATSSVTPSVTPSPGSPSPSISVSSSPVSLSATPSVTPTASVTPSVTPSPTVTPTQSITPSVTLTPTISESPTNSQTPTSTSTPSVSPSSTATPTMTPTSSPLSLTATGTASPSLSGLFSPTPTISITSSLTSSISITRTVSRSQVSASVSASPSPTMSVSPTISPSKSFVAAGLAAETGLSSPSSPLGQAGTIGLAVAIPLLICTALLLLLLAWRRKQRKTADHDVDEVNSVPLDSGASCATVTTVNSETVRTGATTADELDSASCDDSDMENTSAVDKDKRWGKAPETLFISYGRSDFMTSFARKLKLDMQLRGFTVWMDEKNIHSGANFMEAIGEAVENCSAMIALIDKKFTKSKFCKDELHLARIENKAMFPCFLEDVKLPADMKYSLATVNWTRFDTDPYDVSLERLVEGLDLEGVPRRWDHDTHQYLPEERREMIVTVLVLRLRNRRGRFVYNSPFRKLSDELADLICYYVGGGTRPGPNVPPPPIA